MLDRPETLVPARSTETGLGSLPSALPGVLHDVAARALVLLPEADGVVVAVRRPAGPVELASAGTEAHRVDALQRGLREGPVFDAVESGRPVTSGDLTAERRWPRLAGTLGDLGVRSVSSAPVGLDGTVLGTVTAYARRPEVFGVDDAGAGPLARFAATVGTEIRSALELDRARAVVVPGQLAQDARPRRPVLRSGGSGAVPAERVTG